MLVERLLQRVKLPILRYTFDGPDLVPFCLRGKYSAGLDRAPVKMHGARAAVAGVATHVCSRELGQRADEVYQQHAWLYLRRVAFVVDSQRYLPLRHTLPPQSRPSRAARLYPTLDGRDSSLPLYGTLPILGYPR